MMVGGGISLLGSSVVDPHTSPCLCNGDLGLQRKSMGKKHLLVPCSLKLRGSSVNQRVPAKASFSNRNRRCRGLVVVNELGGQYEDNFHDVKAQIFNLFTYKAVRTVLNQLYEMNPTQYRWFYDFVTINKPTDGKRFIRILQKEKLELAERVMVTRLHLYAKWIKKLDHAEMYKDLSDQNVELMRERLMETVVWPSDDTNTEKIG